MHLALAPLSRSVVHREALLRLVAPPPSLHAVSLHDALPISRRSPRRRTAPAAGPGREGTRAGSGRAEPGRSEEHTSELQSRLHLVCRLLLEKKNKTANMLRAPF